MNPEHSIEEITEKQKQMRMYSIIPQTADLRVAGIYCNYTTLAHN